MLIVIDTGLSTTKAAALIGSQLTTVSYPSSVVRGLVNEQGGGIYCIGRTTTNFQIYSVLERGHGLIAIAPVNFREPTNAKRRVLVEHAIAKLGVKGKTSIILTQPAPILFDGGEDQTARIRDAEGSLLKMAVSVIDPASGRPVPPSWKLQEVTASVEAVWGLYDLALGSGAAALDDLGEFTAARVRVGATVAVVDFGTTGTRVHYVEWTGELLPALVMSRYREMEVGTEVVVAQIEARFAERHRYRDVIDLLQLRTDPTILVAGTRVDVSDLVEASIQAAADQLLAAGLNQLKSEVASGQVDHVLFVGGGAHLFGSCLEGELPPDAILTADDPCLAPVRGLLKVQSVTTGNRGGRS